MYIALLGFIALQIYTACLIVLRGKLFGTRVYRPMLWNLFLSLAPILFQLLTLAVLFGILAFIVHYGASIFVVDIFRIVGVLGIALWALLLPNANYLITELNFSHRKKDDPVPEYFDIIMVFSLAMTGFVNALASLAIFHLIVLVIFDPPGTEIPLYSWLIVTFYIILSSFAIYLGRHVRVNSWDVMHPIAFIKRLFVHLKDRNEQKMALGYTIFFTLPLALVHGIFFSILYASVLGRQ